MPANLLDTALVAAHAARDGAEIARLYHQAGDQSADLDAACFFWTNAYVFALEAGIADAELIRSKLVANGREV